MGDLAKLKVAVGQPELSQCSTAFNERSQDRMIALAVESGADLLIVPGSLINSDDVHIIALNDTRIDFAGGVVLVEAAGETYHIALGRPSEDCDFSVRLDLEPWSMGRPEPLPQPGITLRPVGMCNIDKKVLAYDGGTSVYSASGAEIAKLRDDFEEDFAVVSLKERGRIEPGCEDKPLAALVKTIRRFDDQVLGWGPKWVIGLSGGLDSSIVSALLVLALGPERVIGYSLRSKYSSEATISNASYLAEVLGIDLHAGDISELVEQTRGTAESFGYEEGSFTRLALENVQARVRGHLLSTFASLENGVVANNGNRVECAFGYATMYGDSIGALAPIGDLTKARLFQLAQAINGDSGDEIIPQNLLPSETEDGFDWVTMPSAELSEGQRDPMKWFYHDWLIEKLLDAPSIDAGACTVMESYLSGDMLAGPVGKWVRYYGLQDPGGFLTDLESAVKAIRMSAYKRIQAPPAIKIASPASINSSLEVQGSPDPSERYKGLRAQLLRRNQ